MTENKANPLMEKLRLPGESFTLPSLGLFYDDDVIDRNIVKDGEVQVYPMTALDEIIMRTPDRLYSGKAVEEIFERCIPGIKQPLKLFTKDVDFLLMCLRKVTYGDKFTLNYKHNCKDAQSHAYEIDTGQFLRLSVKIDPTTVGELYAVPLPNGQVVHLRPTTYEDVVVIMQEIQTPTGDDDVDEMVMFNQQVKSVLSVIADVDGVDDREFVREWVVKVSAGWIKLISDGIERTSNWGPPYKTTITCRDCGEQVEVGVPINPISFFM